MSRTGTASGLAITISEMIAEIRQVNLLDILF
jgi:hypothetical protein